MFTGIIEEIGVLGSVQHRNQAMTLAIRAQTVLDDMHIGDSIAVNGVCLTVTSFTQNTFTADIMPVTYLASNLAYLQSGDKLNLERALKAGSRLGGHLVSGHIDGMAVIKKIQVQENALLYTLQLPQQLATFCMAKGSIAVDGTSLTIVSIQGQFLVLSLIPHTQKQSILSQKKLGQMVNIECDMLIKQLMNSAAMGSDHSKISLGFLQEHGYA